MAKSGVPTVDSRPPPWFNCTSLTTESQRTEMGNMLSENILSNTHRSKDEEGESNETAKMQRELRKKRGEGQHQRGRRKPERNIRIQGTDPLRDRNATAV